MPQTIEEILSTQRHGFFQTEGDSMEPLIHQHRSTIVVKALQGLPCAGDVVLFRRPTGEYVLHRVVKVMEDACMIRGDNRLHTERVPNAWLLGVMIGFFPDIGAQYVDCASNSYRAYRKSLPFRYARLWLRALPGRAKRKLFHRR